MSLDTSIDIESYDYNVLEEQGADQTTGHDGQPKSPTSTDGSDSLVNVEERDGLLEVHDGSNDGSTDDDDNENDETPPSSLSKLQETILSLVSYASDKFPTSTSGRTLLLACVASAVTAHEVSLQKSLTAPPKTFAQLNADGAIARIYEILTKTPDAILSRPIRPSLFVGTRGMAASAASYFQLSPHHRIEHMKFREIFTMSNDGARLAVDWESLPQNNNPEETKEQILKGKIQTPIILILHGLNNDASFGYVRTMMQACAEKGWVAGGVNFRGTGGVPLTTPRGYNASYTGDIRNLVLQISSRVDEDVPVFLVGNSIGANLMTKYLGEEGASGTLPRCIAGAVSLGNPKSIHSGHVDPFLSVILALGVKKILLKNRTSINQMKESEFQSAIRKGLFATTIGEFDGKIAPILIRNSTFHPYAPTIGFKNGPTYWLNGSSYRWIRHIPIPLLVVTAEDDMLVHKSAQGKLSFSLANPNIMVVQTKCGGHLGWQESPTNAHPLAISSWADVASVDFFQAILDLRSQGTQTGHTYSDTMHVTPDQQSSAKEHAPRSRL